MLLNFETNFLIMDPNTEILLNRSEGESVWVLGDLYTFKATGKQTNGVVTVIDQLIQPQGGPPPHIHHREDEAFYVLEGRFSFLCGDRQCVFESGAFVYIPKGTLHTFRNIGEQQGRLLVVITPAGLEEFFYAIGTRADDTTTPPAFDPSVFGKVMELAKEYKMDVLTDDAK
jgi:mannose-6-phosphate isomerase-like protein (cupin superfamily)